MCFIGTDALQYVNNIMPDAIFFSATGYNKETGACTDSGYEQTVIRRAVIKNSKKKIFLCDSSKIGVTDNYLICNIEDIDEIIMMDSN